MFNKNEALALLGNWQIKDPKTFDLLNKMINAIADNDNTIAAANFIATIKANNGITFPNAQTPSTDPNTLDDYEEGTWIPVDGSGAGLAFTVAIVNEYIKIGKLVGFTVNITYPITASGAGAAIAGLPFTSGLRQYSFPAGYSNLGTDVIGLIQPSSKTILLFNLAGVQYTNAAMSGKTLLFCTQYFANQ